MIPKSDFRSWGLLKSLGETRPQCRLGAADGFIIAI